MNELTFNAILPGSVIPTAAGKMPAPDEHGFTDTLAQVLEGHEGTSSGSAAASIARKHSDGKGEHTVVAMKVKDDDGDDDPDPAAQARPPAEVPILQAYATEVMVPVQQVQAVTGNSMEAAAEGMDATEARPVTSAPGLPGGAAGSITQPAIQKTTHVEGQGANAGKTVDQVAADQTAASSVKAERQTETGRLEAPGTMEAEPAQLDTREQAGPGSSVRQAAGGGGQATTTELPPANPARQAPEGTKPAASMQAQSAEATDGNKPGGDVPVRWKGTGETMTIVQSRGPEASPTGTELVPGSLPATGVSAEEIAYEAGFLAKPLLAAATGKPTAGKNIREKLGIIGSPTRTGEPFEAGQPMDQTGQSAGEVVNTGDQGSHGTAGRDKSQSHEAAGRTVPKSLGAANEPGCLKQEQVPAGPRQGQEVKNTSKTATGEPGEQTMRAAGSNHATNADPENKTALEPAGGPNGDQNGAVVAAEVKPAGETRSAQTAKQPDLIVARPGTLVEQIVQHAKLIVGNDRTDLRIHLTPEHLGRVDVRIVMDRGGVVVQLNASTEVARQIIEADLAKLKEGLQAQGISADRFLLNTNVTSGGQRFNDGGGSGWTQRPSQQWTAPYRQETGQDTAPRQTKALDRGWHVVDFRA